MPRGCSNYFLVASIKHLCYSFTYLEAIGSEAETLIKAKEVFDDMVRLTENAHTFDECFKYAEFVKSC